MLKGTKASLRPAELLDIDVLFEWSRKGQVCSFFLDSRSEVPMRSRDEFLAEMGSSRNRPDWMPLVIEDCESSLLGFLQIRAFAWETRATEIRFLSLEESKYSHPSFTEAGLMALEYLFKGKNLERIFTRSLENEKMLELFLRNLGFVNEGTTRETVYSAGGYLGMTSWGMLREEALQRSLFHDKVAQREEFDAA